MHMRHSYQISKKWYFMILLVLVISTGLVVARLLSPPILSLTILPVDSGQTLLLETPTHHFVLINAGGDRSILIALGETLPEWQRHLDALILTDLKSTESFGAPDVLSRYSVTRLIRPALSASKTTEDALASFSKNTEVIFGKAGDTLTMGNVVITLLWPPKTPTPLQNASGNLAIRITYGKTSFVVLGDLPKGVLKTLQNQLANSYLIASSTKKETIISNGFFFRVRK